MMISLASGLGMLPHSRLVFFPSVAMDEFRYGPIVERHRAGLLARSLREQIGLLALLDHDPAQVVGSVAAGTLAVSLEARGPRCELDLARLDDTPATRRLRRALATGQITGSSFGFRSAHARWYRSADGRWPVRELVVATVTELSLLVAPLRPANAHAGAALWGPSLLVKHAALRAKAGAGYSPPPKLPPADVTLRLITPPRSLVDKILFGERLDLEHEQRAVEAAARAHPHARTVDVIYPRRVADLIQATARHANVFSSSGGSTAGTAAAKRTPAPSARPMGPGGVFGRAPRSPSSPLKGVTPMHDDRLPVLHAANMARREIVAGGCDPHETARLIGRFNRDLRRVIPEGAPLPRYDLRPYVDDDGVQRLLVRRRRLTVSEARAKLARHRA